MEQDSSEQSVSKVSSGTFIIDVQYRSDSSWKGRITWADQKREQHFRSTFEMLKLMQEALNER